MAMLRSGRLRYVLIYLCFLFQLQAQDLYVLSIGVEPWEIEKGTKDWYALDAEHVRRAFVKAESQYTTVHSRVLNGLKATPNHVLEACAWMSRSLKKEDVGVIFFSTHGNLDKQKKFYFDLAPEKKDKVSSSLYGRDFHRALKNVQGKLVIFADTCHSESIILEKEHKNMSVIAACAREESSYGQFKREDQAHGYFVIALCEGLRGAALKKQKREGTIQLEDLARYIATRTAKMHSKQTCVSHIHDDHKGIVLSKIAKYEPIKRIDSDNKKYRNPFEVDDVIEADHSSVMKSFTKLTIVESENNPNAEKWNTKTIKGQVHSIDGEWECRWKEDGDEAWVQGSAWIKTKNKKVYILYKDQYSEYLMQCNRMKGKKLAGRYMNLKSKSDTGAWAGVIISPQQIDGKWSGGRWDLRRKLEKLSE